MNNPALPEHSSLDIEAFSRIFRNRNSSYKFLWMQAILRVVALGKCHDNTIPVNLLVAHMFEIAKYPLRKFRLAFGLNDRIDMHLRDLGEMRAWEDLQRNIFECNIAGRAEEIPGHIVRKMMKFVPYRMLIPFFSGNQLGKFSERTQHEIIATLSRRNFDSEKPPLYRLLPGMEAIELHPLWRNYLEVNLPIVEAWAKWHWAKYLQTCNPNSPAIQSKLGKPDSRAALSREREFWRWVIGKRAGEIICIFSGEDLDMGDFALDHYLPRDFIAHDQIWNLSPVSQAANAQKSNMLPPRESFERFVQIQHIGLTTCHAARPGKYRKLMDEYLAGINVSVWNQNPPSLADLQSAYSQVILPLWQLAKNNGFKIWSEES